MTHVTRRPHWSMLFSIVLLFQWQWKAFSQTEHLLWQHGKGNPGNRSCPKSIQKYDHVPSPEAVFITPQLTVFTGKCPSSLSSSTTRQVPVQFCALRISIFSPHACIFPAPSLCLSHRCPVPCIMSLISSCCWLSRSEAQQKHMYSNSVCACWWAGRDGPDMLTVLIAVDSTRHLSFVSPQLFWLGFNVCVQSLAPL